MLNAKATEIKQQPDINDLAARAVPNTLLVDVESKISNFIRLATKAIRNVKAKETEKN